MYLDSDTAITVAQFTKHYVEMNGPVTMDKVFSLGPYSVIKPALCLASLTYMIFVPFLLFIYAITRPSEWVYKYLWAFFQVNFIQMVNDNALFAQQYVNIRTQHIDEYGTDLRKFWPRVWFYTLPLNSLVFMFSVM